MFITTNDISDWANSRASQGLLPRLIRRLVGRNGSITALSVPAEDSVSLGGFDGEVFSESATAWVPKGRSVWEMSVNGQPTKKANSDYLKRTRDTTKKHRAGTTYVAVTARKWSTKGKWLEQKRAQGDWNNVLGYDADDLEAWLEQETPTQIWFAELLGRSVFGMRSPESFWADWNRDVRPPVSHSALIGSRSEEAKRLLELLKKKPRKSTIVVHADSSDEAVAFACATLTSDEQRRHFRSTVVSESGSWSTVASNENIEVAIVSRPTLSEAAPAREELTVIVPYASGQNEAHFPGHPGLDVDPDICLQRNLPEAFREGLEDIGVEKGDARRLAIQCGRSWSVYRRLKNTNPVNRQPTWQDGNYENVLSVMALIGGFDENNESDREFVEMVAQIPISRFMAAANKLVLLDDAPLVRINGVVKAKAVLELFKLNEAGVSREMFDRFMKGVEALFKERDPVFEMPSEDRWLANVEGKVRPQSGALLRSIASALPRVSVLSAVEGREWRVRQIAQELLSDADEIRWLSLSDVLQQISEAAPDEFLTALETDLRSDEPQVFALFKESGGAGIHTSFYHTDLLWALEGLAWAPQRLVRVARCLADFCEAPISENVGNSPMNSLLNIFRAWRPQTSATLEMRNDAISVLNETHPNQTFDLCMGILYRGQDMASPSHRPEWRDDDAGAAEAVTNVQFSDAMRHAASLAFELAQGDPERVTRLFERYDIFHDEFRAIVLDKVEQALVSAEVDGRRKIRKALRHKLHWELNYGEEREGFGPADLLSVEKLYHDSEPEDTVERHAWLFENSYCELPEKEGKRSSKQAQQRTDDLREEALGEVFGQEKFEGLSRLSDLAGPYNCVGQSVHKLSIEKDELVDWAASCFLPEDDNKLIGDWLRSLADPDRAEMLVRILERGRMEYDWGNNHIISFLRLARSEPSTWETAEALSGDVGAAYWNNQLAIPIWLDLSDRKHGIQRLLHHGNAAAALRSLQHCERDFDGPFIADILERNFASEDHGFDSLAFHDLTDLIEAMEQCERLDRERLLRLEFQMVVSFGQFLAERMSELLKEIASDPEQLLHLVTKVYKPDNKEMYEATDEAEQRLARACSHLLFYLNRTPGLSDDGKIDEPTFGTFVRAFLSRAKEEGYFTGAQIVLGELLAHSPPADDGSWPQGCVCGVLDVPEHEEMRRSFQTGVYNSRGITSRSPYDGGGQERDLAARYDNHAQRVQITHPLVSTVLTTIADGYRSDALRHDRAAEFSKERF